jgi:AsmA protein
LLVVVGAIIVATKVIDPNRYRGQVEAIVRDLTGRPFEIRGDLRLSWFPWIGVETGAAQLGNPLGTAGPPQVEWESIQVRARLLPLLHREIVIDRIRLERPHVHLRRGADGHGNWEDLISGVPTQSAQSPPGSNGNPGHSQAAQIAGLDLHDGTLEFLDEGTGTRVELTGWDLSVGAWKPGQSFPVTSRFVLHTELLPPAGMPMDIEAPKLTVRTSPLSIGVPKLSVSAPNLTVAITNANATTHADPITNVSATTHTDQPMSTGAPRAGATASGNSGSAANIPASAATISAANDLHASGTLSAETRSLRNLLASLGVNTALTKDPETLAALTLTGTWEIDSGAIALKPLTLHADGTTFSGWVRRSSAAPSGNPAIAQSNQGGATQSRNPSPAQPTWSFELHGDHIDLGRYIESDRPRTRPLELPVETLRSLRAQGTLVLDEATFGKSRMKNIRLRLESQE